MKLITDLPPFGKPTQAWVTGVELRRMLKKASTTRTAVIDHDLCTGRIALIGMTGARAGPITKVPRGYRCTMASLSPLELADLRYGWGRISTYHNKKPTDAAIARFIKRAGADRVLAVLDEYTRPPAETDVAIATTVA